MAVTSESIDVASGAPGRLESFVATCARSTGWVVALLSVVYVWQVAAAPIDSVQGPIQKILYIHPPLAYGAYLGFVTTGLGGLLYLWRGDEIFDRMAIAGAEVGTLFCTLMMITGPIWGKGTWGVWWSWIPDSPSRCCSGSPTSRTCCCVPSPILESARHASRPCTGSWGCC